MSGAGGRRLAFIEAGPRSDLPSTVFVHGAGGSRQSWLLLLRDLAKRGLHGLALELPGHGASPGPGCSDIGEYAGIVQAFIEENLPSKTVLAGHSMGGAVAQECGLASPGILRGLILIGTGARLRVRKKILSGLLSDFEATAADIAPLLYSPAAPAALLEEGRRRLLECPPGVMHGDFLACDAFSRMEEAGKIRLPTLVVCGSDDVLTPPKYSRFLAENIPAASLQIVERAGHMVMVERPSRVGEAIHGFISSLGH